ncbi:membrane protein [Arthrobacter sp. SPG23]|nr:membrane protein [Arthrobacter sp. SPG23]
MHEDPDIKKELREAAGTAEEVTNSRPLEIMARAGFAVSGILHFLVGAIAIRLAMGGEGKADVSGAVEELSGQPAGPILLWSSFAACVALAIWQTSDAIFDFSHLPKREKIGKKLKAAGQAVVFAGFAVTLASFAIGTGKDNSRSTSDFTIALMKAPGGVALLIVIGAAVAVAGIVYGIRGVRKSFEKNLRMPAPGTTRTAVSVLGVVGYVAKGFALLLVGLLIVIATIRSHPEESTGLDGGLKALRDQPFGLYLLAAAGIGLICYGVYSMMRAKLAKM